MKFPYMPRAQGAGTSHPAPRGGAPPHGGSRHGGSPHGGSPYEGAAVAVAAAPPHPPPHPPAMPRFTPAPAAPPAPPRSAKPVPATPMKLVGTDPGRRSGGESALPARAIIGDALRIPILWCDFGSCVGHYTSPSALGERDLRSQAQETGWRYDALGRLACPSCVQRDSAFWPICPPAVFRQ